MKKRITKILMLTIFAVILFMPKIKADAIDLFFSEQTIHAYPDYLTGRYMISFNEKDDRNIGELKVTATINGTVYEGTVGSKDRDGFYPFEIKYPTVPRGTEIVVNIMGGSLWDSETVTMDYYLKYDIVGLNEAKVYPESLKGSFKCWFDNQEDAKKTPNLKVTATIAGTVYNGTFNKDDNGNYNYEVKYPTQKRGTPIEVTVTDGTITKTKTFTMDYFLDFHITLLTNEAKIYPKVLTCPFYCTILNEEDKDKFPDLKVTATIEGKVYNGTVSKDKEYKYKLEVNYPEQKRGTDIVVNITDGTISQTETFTTDYYIEYNINVKRKNILPTQITGTATTYPESYGMEGIDGDKGFTVVAKIGDETYEGKVSGNKFTINYPQQAFDTKVKISIRDRFDGYTTKKTCTIINIEPKLKVDEVNYTTTYITGKTAPNLKVWVWCDDGEFKGKADKKGNFKIKIPEQKTGNKMAVGCIDKNSFFNMVDITVSEPSTYVSLDNYVLKNSSKVTVNLGGVLKGDYLVVKIGNRSYKKVFKSSKASKVSIKINKPEVGSKVTITLYNKHNQKRDYATGYVYLAEDPSIGMTKKQVKQTAWGSPSSINTIKIGGRNYEQWSYDFGRSWKYLWFENGALKNINSYSY